MILVLVFAGAAYAAHAWYADHRLAAARSAAVAAASDLALAMVTISATTVDSDLARVAAGATPDFRQNLGGVRAAVLAGHVQSTGRVLRAALVSGDARTAEVLVAVDALIKTPKAPDGRTTHYRLRLSLALDTGRWLLAKLRYVS
ncbi:hypothetical protein [Hamadaea tsunoensis]|uniref:hypothetical protein n=1 Tax=Hamadaea tsunoensis TaxID=53368 RepID=UPI0012F87765|nr:hypothetical protein [Hamadaea tsunoensis]